MPLLTRNLKALESFTKYCNDHPEQRFWQALCNWSKYRFILGSNIYHADIDVTLVDTFCLEGMEGTCEQD